MASAADPEKDERMRKIRQLLQGSDSSDDEVGVGSNNKSRKTKNKSKAKAKNKQAPRKAVVTFVPDVASTKTSQDEKEVTESGLILFNTRFGAADSDYEDEFAEEYNDELEMFGSAEEGVAEEWKEDEEEDDDDYENESSDSEIEFGLRKAIGIEEDDIENYNTEEDPMNGSQFLLRAMQESKKLPKIAVADLELLRAKLAAKINTSTPVRQKKTSKRRSRKSQAQATNDTAELNGNLAKSIHDASGNVVEDEKVTDRESDEMKNSHESEVSDDKSASESDSSTDEELSDIVEAAKPGVVRAQALVPDPDWEAKALEAFKRLRGKVDRQRQKLENNMCRLPHTDITIPDAGQADHWFRFCFGRRIGFNADCAKFAKTAPKKAQNLSVEEFCREYLDQFFLKTEPSSNSAADVARMNMNSRSLSEGDRNHSQFQATIIFNEFEGERLAPAMKDNNSTDAFDHLNLIPYNGCTPLLSILLKIPQRSLEKLLKHNIQWLSENYSQFINKQQCEWLYSLLVCLQLPLEPDVVSDLRDIVRSCKKQRKVLGQIMRKNKELVLSPEDNELIHQYLNSINLFITLVGNYFRQKDLLAG